MEGIFPPFHSQVLVEGEVPSTEIIQNPEGFRAWGYPNRQMA